MSYKHSRGSTKRQKRDLNGMHNGKRTNKMRNGIDKILKLISPK